MTTPSEFGQRVRRELAENGWIRYQPFTSEGACLMGASAAALLHLRKQLGHQASEVTDQWIRAMEDKIKELEPSLRCTSRPVAAFNDDCLLDAQDALDFCDKVIAGLQEQGR